MSQGKVQISFVHLNKDVLATKSCNNVPLYVQYSTSSFTGISLHRFIYRNFVTYSRFIYRNFVTLVHLQK